MSLTKDKQLNPMEIQETDHIKQHPITAKMQGGNENGNVIFSNVVTKIANQSAAVTDGVKKELAEAADGVKKGFAEAADDVKKGLVETANNVGDAANDLVQKVADKTAHVTEDVTQKIIQTADNVGDAANDFVQNVADKTIRVADGVADGIGKGLHNITGKTGGAGKNSKYADNDVLTNKINKLRNKIKKYRYTIRKKSTGGTKIKKTTIPKLTKKNDKMKDSRTNHHAKTIIPYKINDNNEKYYECPHCFKIFSHAPAFIQHSKRCSKKPSDWDEKKYFKPISN